MRRLPRTLVFLAALLVAAGAALAAEPSSPEPIFKKAFERVAPSIVRVVVGERWASGLIASTDGLVVTALPLVEKKNQVKALMPDGKMYQAKVLLRDKTTGLAILQLSGERAEEPRQTKSGAKSSATSKEAAKEPVKEPARESAPAKAATRTWPAVSFGPSAALKPGLWVATVAYPVGADLKMRSEASLSADILSARSRLGDRAGYDGEVLVTDATMNLGSEGGALIDTDGQVVGILLGPQRHAETSTAINAALPIEIVPPLLKRAREKPDAEVENGRTAPPTHGFLGVIRNPNEPEPIVADIVPGSPAEKAGLEIGDLIIKINGRDVTSFDDVLGVLRGSKPNDKVVLIVVRQLEDGPANKKIEVTLGEYPKE